MRKTGRLQLVFRKKSPGVPGHAMVRSAWAGMYLGMTHQISSGFLSPRLKKCPKSSPRLVTGSRIPGIARNCTCIPSTLPQVTRYENNFDFLTIRGAGHSSTALCVEYSAGN